MINCPTGFLWYQKEENQLLLNESQQPDGWVPLPISVNPKDMSKEDLADLAEAISQASQFAIYVDQNSPYATDAKDNSGQSSLRPFRTLERALVEAARRSFRIGAGGLAGNDITDRISIYLAPGYYDIENGFGGQQMLSDYNRRQDAAKLLLVNKTYLVDKAYEGYQSDPLYTLTLTPEQVLACKRDISYFVDAVAKDIARGGNEFILRAAKAIIDSNGSFIAAYSDENKRISTMQAIRLLRDLSRTAIKNQLPVEDGAIQLSDIAPDADSYSNPCFSIQQNSDTLYEILLSTLSVQVDPYTIAINPGEDSASFPTEGEPLPRTLRSFNSQYKPGVILPRGVSIIGADLRKVIIRPKYVPDPADDTVGRSAIFRMTGGNFFSGFSIMDRPDTEFSHHKLSCFEFCNFGDLNAYYDKVAIAFSDSQRYNRLQDASDLLWANIRWMQRQIKKSFVPETKAQKKYVDIFEAEIPSLVATISDGLSKFGNEGILQYARRFKRYHIDPIEVQTTKEQALLYYSSLCSRLQDLLREAVSNRASIYEGGYIDDRIIIDPVNPTNPCQDVQAMVGTFVQVLLATIKGEEIPEVSFQPWSLEDTSPTLPEYQIVGDYRQNPISGASPYIYSASLRSRWGLCGIDADGDQVGGFKSFVAAQFTVISMQSDPRAFTNQDIEGEVLKRYVGTRSYDLQDYRHFGYRVRNEAYAQLVSCFCIGPAVHYWTDSGAEFSITNSTSNFGDVSLYALRFVDDGIGGGAYSQDTEHRLLGVRKPVNLELINRIFVMGYVKSNGTTLDVGSSPETGSITLTGLINTQGYTIDDPTYPTRLYVRLPGNTIASADVISYANNEAQTETTLNVRFNDPYAAYWNADDTSQTYTRGLIGAAVYIERYVDTRSSDEKLYKLLIEKAQGDELSPRREPVVNYIFRKGGAATAEEQPFDGLWDTEWERGRTYYVESLAKNEELLSTTLASGEVYELLMLSGYYNVEGQMEYYEDAIGSASLDTLLDVDPRYPIDLSVDSVSRRAVEHILSLMGITYTTADLDLSEDNIFLLSTEPPLVEFNKPSIIRCAGQTWEYVGYYNYDTALPIGQPKKVGEGLPPLAALQKKLSKTQTQLKGGRVYATGMDEEGNQYAGNRVLDLKTGEQKAINLGSTPSAGDEYVPTEFDNLYVDKLYTDEGFFNTLSADVGNLNQLNAVNLDTSNLLTTQDLIVRGLAQINSLEVFDGNFNQLNAVNVDTSNLLTAQNLIVGDSAQINSLEVFDSNFNQLNAVNADISNLLTTQNLTVGGLAQINSLEVSDSNFNQLNAVNADISDLLTTQNLIVGDSAQINSLEVFDDYITLNADATETGYDWKLIISRALVGQTKNLRFTFPADNGSVGDVLTTDGQGHFYWDSSSSPIVSAAAPVLRSTGGELRHGDLWWESDSGILYIYYSDLDSSQWVALTKGKDSASGSSAVSLLIDSKPPQQRSDGTALINGDLWFDTISRSLNVWFQYLSPSRWVAVSEQDAQTLGGFSPSYYLDYDNLINKPVSEDAQTLGGFSPSYYLDYDNLINKPVGEDAQTLGGFSPSYYLDYDNLINKPVSEDGGGGGRAIVAPTAPDVNASTQGDLWYNSTIGSLFILYDEGDSKKWVQVEPPTTATIDSVSPGSGGGSEPPPTSAPSVKKGLLYFYSSF